jgi:ribosomal protein S18 acetylase RimI-like enzyme
VAGAAREEAAQNFAGRDDGEDIQFAHLTGSVVLGAERRRDASGPRVLAWARENSVACVNLWVTETNEPALRLYEACGFERTGQRQPLPSDPSDIEVAVHRVVLRP